MIYVFTNLANVQPQNNLHSKNDKHKRFLLGQHGTRGLLAIGLNPRQMSINSTRLLEILR